MKSVLLFVLTFIVFARALGGEFLYDDEFLIQKNLVVQNLELLPEAFLGSSTAGSGGQDSFYRPLQIISYSLVHFLFGLDPFWFHLLNILIHSLNALLLFWLLQKVLTVSCGICMTIALIWGLHPIHTEAVSYISATADPLHFFFGLIFLHLMLKPSWKMKGLGLLALLAAFLSKEAAVTFPGLLFACLLSIKVKGSEKLSQALKGSLLQVLPPLALALLYVYFRGTLLNFDHSFQFYQTENIYTSSVLNRILTAFAALPDYLGLLFWPAHLQIDRSFPVHTSLFDLKVVLGTILFLISLIPFFVGSLVFSFFSLWFWSYHVLNTGILLPLNSLFLEHWMYIPSVGVVGAFVEGIHRLFKMWHWPKKAFLGFFVVVGTALGVRTWIQSQVWLSPITLYEHILKGSPDVARVHNNLAMALSDQGNLKEAERHYLKSLKLNDSYPQTWHNLGLLHLRQGKIDEGIGNLEKAVSINPRFFPSYLYLSKAYEFKGEKEKAKAAFEKYKELTKPLKEEGFHF